MSQRVSWICHAPTAATRALGFAGDEPVETRALAKVAGLAQRIGRADRCWISPALPARQTAAALGLSAVADEALRDCHYGRWAGRSFAAVEGEEPDALRHWLTDPAAAPHGGESMIDVMRRIETWMKIHQEDSGHTVVVTHAPVVRAALILLLQAPPTSLLRIDVAPLARAVTSRHAGQWRLQSLARLTREVEEESPPR